MEESKSDRAEALLIFLKKQLQSRYHILFCVNVLSCACCEVGMLSPGDSFEKLPGIEPCSDEDRPLAPDITQEESDDSDDSDPPRELPPWAADESSEAFVNDDDVLDASAEDSSRDAISNDESPLTETDSSDEDSCWSVIETDGEAEGNNDAHKGSLDKCGLDLALHQGQLLYPGLSEDAGAEGDCDNTPALASARPSTPVRRRRLRGNQSKPSAIPPPASLAMPPVRRRPAAEAACN